MKAYSLWQEVRWLQMVSFVFFVRWWALGALAPFTKVNGVTFPSWRAQSCGPYLAALQMALFPVHRIRTRHQVSGAVQHRDIARPVTPTCLLFWVPTAELL
jgi:hypothetical protein